MDVRDARARLILDALPKPEEVVRLAKAEAAHARARRLSAGDPVLLLDGSGRMAVAQVVLVTRADVLVKASEILEAAPAARSIRLFVAGLRADRLAWLVEKATELGAARVTIVESERTQSFRANESLLPRLDRVAREAAKQSERPDWPRVDGPIAFARAIEEETAAQRFLFDPEGGPFPDRVDASENALAVGPEGGWSDSEKEEASSRGWRIVRLPARKLRAETAAIAGLLLVSAAMERESG
jgi:16S rRNA (uracil1498-N3)-methyltransferase